MGNRTLAVVLICVVLVLLFAYFVWPGRYEYGADGRLRTHRVTGVAEVLTSDGWRRMDRR